MESVGRERVRLAVIESVQSTVLEVVGDACDRVSDAEKDAVTAEECDFDRVGAVGVRVRVALVAIVRDDDMERLREGFVRVLLNVCDLVEDLICDHVFDDDRVAELSNELLLELLVERVLSIDVVRESVTEPRDFVTDSDGAKLNDTEEDLVDVRSDVIVALAVREDVTTVEADLVCDQRLIEAVELMDVVLEPFTEPEFVSIIDFVRLLVGVPSDVRVS